MHQFLLHIGDFEKKAGRLSLLQDGVYNRLMRACYDRERFPTKAEAVEWTWAGTTAEVEALDFVLSRFFRQDDHGVFIQNRIADELESYREFCQKQADKGRLGGRPKQNPVESQRKATANQTLLKNNPAGSETKPAESQRKALPITDNLLPITDTQDKPASDKPPALIDKVSKVSKAKPLQTLSTYLAARKAAGMNPFDEGCSAERYMNEIGMPSDLFTLHWFAFKLQHTEGVRKDKKQRDWQATFTNSLKANWYKLWWVDAEGRYVITTIGKQTEMEKAARKGQA